MQRFTVPGKGGHIAGLNFGRAHGPIDVAFLHATGFCALAYRRLLEPLGPQFRVVALDLRGHGHTTLPARPAKLAHWYGYAQDVIGALRQIAGREPSGPGDLSWPGRPSGPGEPPGPDQPPGPRKPGARSEPAVRLLAGHSLGGTVALLALAADPALAGSLLMIDPAMVPPRIRGLLMLPFAPQMLRRRLPIARSAARRRSQFPALEEVLASYRGRGAFRTWLPGFLEDYVEDAFARRPDGSVTLRCAPDWESATFAAHRHDLRGALRALRVPARLLLAERESTAARMLGVIRECAPALDVEVVPGSTHFLPMEQPERVREAMVRLVPTAGADAGDPKSNGSTSDGQTRDFRARNASTRWAR